MTSPVFLDIHKIRKILPHRYPFLLVDRVLDYQPKESLTALKNVTANEPFFQGHFPDHPVFPGVLILEALAQSSAIHAALDVGDDIDDEIIFLFAGIDHVRFKRQVEPGDSIVLNVHLSNYKRRIWKYKTTATVDDHMAAVAEVIFTYQVVSENG
ncbi:MAG: 3-hydroxyacyl-ACP dehydratase FabZ [Gammaproteobacteria bacterium]|nr:3-hydroxyacyl-ACP dehydratase FabZ [Gammaproteobacteria bacterium]MCY4217773.1 3-hydroxyacyl-ACP dehydratase FabZ [Gammaproteobacteria bacterium]MCY4274466.1 3-hydroxyacyl-ACP dehydratase FabZ [Gammaproteobacteria bacterium]